MGAKNTFKKKDGLFNMGYSIPTRTLRKGYNGNDVKWLQSMLNKCGSILIVDGIFGNKTHTAIRNFQYHNGLTVDCLAGINTRKTLIACVILKDAKDYGKYLVKHDWHYKNRKYKAKSTFATTKKCKYPGSSCAHFVSWILQDAGLLKNGKILTHTPAGYGIGPKAIKGAGNLIRCEIFYPNANIKKCVYKLKEGDIIVQDSSIGIYDRLNGAPVVHTARSGQTLDKSGKYIKTTIKSGYEFTRPVLAVVRFKG